MAEKEEKSRRQICLRLFFVPLLWQEQVAEGLLEGAVDDGWIVGVDGAGEAYAVYKNDDAIKRLKNSGAFNTVEGRYRIELWKYNPALLAKDGVVDALSLALCYKGSDDERVIGLRLSKLFHR